MCLGDVFVFLYKKTFFAENQQIPQKTFRFQNYK